jgi:hypothetical protein
LAEVESTVMTLRGALGHIGEMLDGGGRTASQQN